MAGRGRENSIRKLFTLLKEEDLADPVVQSLSHIDPDQAGFLIDYLSNDNALVRQTVAQVLGDLPYQRPAEDALIRLLAGRERTRAEHGCRWPSDSCEARRRAPAFWRSCRTNTRTSRKPPSPALAAIGDESVLDSLLKDFSTHEAYLRRNIACLLGKFSSQRVLRGPGLCAQG